MAPKATFLALLAAGGASAALTPLGRQLRVHRAPERSSDSCVMPSMRPSPASRTYAIPAVDALIANYSTRFKDPNLATLFANTLPNAIDTTVFRFANATTKGGPDAFMVTGDIDAMWLRDSANQVWPYLRFVAQDTAAAQLIQGVIARHARSVLLDPYANAFQVDSTAGQGPHADDSTSRPAYAGTTIDAMTPAIFERKWEVDSLANALRLAGGYFAATNGADLTPFAASTNQGATWQASVELILDTFVAQQLDTAEEDALPGGAPYQFQRQTGEPSDTLEHGRGAVCRHTGMIKSAFRGSDDATVLPFSIPENAFAASALRAVAPVLTAVGRTDLATRAVNLATEVEAAIAEYGVYTHPRTGTKIYAYEVDGFGNYWFQDDANIPGLVSMPYYGFAAPGDALYAATRAAVLSNVNPYYICGSAACGVGGQHNGYYWIWPMALIAQGWTSTNATEVAALLDTLVQSSACTGLIHESFDHNSFGSYTRPWFAWVNGLFADWIIKVAEEMPQLIFK